VKRLIMLVTSDGRWVLEDSVEFLAALGDPDPDYDATLFAVKNLGFVKFQLFDDSLIEIELHPHNVELPALLAVQQQIISAKAKLFRLKFFESSWRSEIFSTSEHAVSRLSELCSPKFAPTSKEKFLIEPQHFLTLFDTKENPLRLMAQKWRASFGHFDPSVISFAIKHDLLSRLMIAGVTPGRSEPVFRFIGDGHANWLDSEYRFRAIGEKLENFPDKDYGAWLSQFYKNVARTGEPRYDYVTAAIQKRPDTYVTRYERLLLPWKTPSDEILVTLSSQGIVADPDSESLSEPSSPDEMTRAAKKLARSV
jgi:hypothetical protein